MPAANTTGRSAPGIARTMFSRRMLVAFIMGFSSGLPLLLTITLLQAWMKEEGVDLAVIGLMALVGLPYTLKFVWAPLLDRGLFPRLGRRRGWLLISQVLLIAAIVLLAFCRPAAHPVMLAGAAFLVTFFSASQDICIDAYRREDLADQELGLGSSLAVNGYRLGMLLAGGGGLLMADHMSFAMVYLIMAACMGVGLVTTLFTPEPEAPLGMPLTMKEAVVEPFVEFFSRSGLGWGLGVLAFILLYKLGDSMASAMTTPFYLDIGYSKTQIGAVVKLFGFWATITGGLLGGLLIIRMGINLSLWIFGFLQAISTAGFAVLAGISPLLHPAAPMLVTGGGGALLLPAGLLPMTGWEASSAWLAVVIAFENLTSGMGTAAYVAFMARLTNKKFTATQYALLSSLMGVPRVLASAPTGYMAQTMGWAWFFVFCTLIAIPGMLMLVKFAPPGRDAA